MPRPARPTRPGRIAVPLATVAAVLLAGCGVVRVPSTVPHPAAPLPLVVGVCALPDGAPTEPFGPDGALFARVVDARAAGARPDVVARLTVTPVVRDVRENSVGFFMWTLGLVPMLTDVEQTTTATFAAPATGADPCASAPAADTGLAIAAEGGQTEVVGWVAWLLQPTPWWSGSDRVDGEPMLARRQRAALARAVIERRAEIMALAGR